MSFLNKFQYHYHSRYLDELSNSENYLELLSYLEKLSNEKKIFHDLSFKYVNHAIHSLSDDVSNKKIVWINSFLIIRLIRLIMRLFLKLKRRR